jgi:hypothetical protein
MAAIISSILLAFWIDAWWGGVQARSAEREILDGLRDEFIGHQAALNEAIHWSRNAIQAAELLAEHAVADDQMGDSVAFEVERALYRVNTAYMSDLRGGVRDALIASGRLELLRSADLRQRLSRWGSVVDDVSTNEAAIRGFVLGEITPYVASQQVPLVRSFEWGDDSPPADLPNATVRSLYSDLTHQLRFQNLLSARRLWDGGSLRKYEAAVVAVDGILALVSE